MCVRIRSFDTGITFEEPELEFPRSVEMKSATNPNGREFVYFMLHNIVQSYNSVPWD